MKELVPLFFLLISLGSCAQTGYTPAYIISDVETESYIEAPSTEE